MALIHLRAGAEDIPHVSVRLDKVFLYYGKLPAFIKWLLMTNRQLKIRPKSNFRM